MEGEFTFTIPGDPIPKGRPRGEVRTGEYGGHYVKMHTPKQTQEAEENVGWSFKAEYPGQEPLTGDVWLNLTFAEAPKPRQRQSDLDNLQKLVLDGLNGVAWADDKQVVLIHAFVWRNYGESAHPDYKHLMEPHTRVTIRTWTDGEKGEG